MSERDFDLLKTCLNIVFQENFIHETKSAQNAIEVAFDLKGLIEKEMIKRQNLSVNQFDDE